MRNFSGFFSEFSESEDGKALLEKMNVLDYKGSVDDIEWELFSMYTTLALRKKHDVQPQKPQQPQQWAPAPPALVQPQQPELQGNAPSLPFSVVCLLLRRGGNGGALPSKGNRSRTLNSAKT